MSDMRFGGDRPSFPTLPTGETRPVPVDLGSGGISDAFQAHTGDATPPPERPAPRSIGDEHASDAPARSFTSPSQGPRETVHVSPAETDILTGSTPDDSAPEADNPNETTPSGPATVTERAQKYYKDRDTKYGLTADNTSLYLNGTEYALMNEGDYISVQKPDSEAARQLRDRYGFVVKDVLDKTNVKEMFPEAWRDLPNTLNDPRISDYTYRSSDPGFKKSGTHINRHIATMPDQLIKEAKIGRLENVTVQAISPEDVDIEQLQWQMEHRRPIYGDGIEVGKNDFESYFLVKGELYQGSSLGRSENRRPVGPMSSLIIATRGVWNAGGDNRIVVPRLYNVISPLNRQLVDSRTRQSHGAVTAIEAYGAAHPYITGMGTRHGHGHDRRSYEHVRRYSGDNDTWQHNPDARRT